MTIRKLFPLLFIIVFLSCDSKKVTDRNDYQVYLQHDIDDSKAFEEINFWSIKLDNTPNQFPYLVKRASAYTNLFDSTGKIEYLNNAEKDLTAANRAVNYKNSSYLKALAHNYVTQHKFKEALAMLQKAEVLGEKLLGTQKMLFDVHLELGNYEEAEKYLTIIKNFSDFDYIIRLAKWEDHNGNLDGAISYMERAVKISESSNNKPLKQWSYTNLADFYGHSGKINMSYSYYLKALELDPNDAYAKKGIAWIVYSYEKNPDEALAIINNITTYYNAPDYNLLKAEIAEFKNNESLKNRSLEDFRASLSNTLYGDMYNTYSALHYADDLQLPEKAITIAMLEVKNRPTIQSYDLLAWSYFKAGETDKAEAIIDKHVKNNTEEPDVLYHIAEIYKAKGREQEVSNLKEELLASVYELGPLMKTKIERL